MRRAEVRRTRSRSSSVWQTAAVHHSSARSTQQQQLNLRLSTVRNTSIIAACSVSTNGFYRTHYGHYLCWNLLHLFTLAPIYLSSSADCSSEHVSNAQWVRTSGQVLLPLKSQPKVSRPVYSDTTQLNSTSSCRHVHSVNNSHLSMNVVTQLTQFVGSEWRHKQKHDWLGCTLFNWVEFGWVELCRYKHPLRLKSKLNA